MQNVARSLGARLRTVKWCTVAPRRSFSVWHFEYFAGRDEVLSKADCRLGIALWGTVYTSTCGLALRNSTLLGSDCIMLCSNPYNEVYHNSFVKTALRFSLVNKNQWKVRIVPTVEPLDTIQFAKSYGFHTVAMTESALATPVESFPYGTHKKMLVFAGVDQHDLPEDIVKACDQEVKIGLPLNPIHRLSILAYEMNRQKLLETKVQEM
eukprot:Platyproteum_vivax@DN2762_c0_g1_i1.p1